jgi:hypothetical protein
MQLITAAETAHHVTVAACVVCGKPIVNATPTKDGSMRHKRCAFLSPPEARNELVERLRRKHAQPAKKR